MLRLDAPTPASFCDNATRRDFIHAGSLATLGLTLPGYLRAKETSGVKDSDVNCIMLFLLGGPSHIDTWDMKPNAPAEIRGPFQPIKTKATGIQISEVFPKMAKHADKYSLIRSVYHTATAVHDTGHQMMQTGRLFTGGSSIRTLAARLVTSGAAAASCLLTCSCRGRWAERAATCHTGRPRATWARIMTRSC